MDGRAFTNKELASAACITPQTTSAHMKRLENAGLTVSQRSGRNVYHRLAGEKVADLLESLAGLSPTDHLHRAKSRGLPEAKALMARSCYNHIAGRLGVLILQKLRARGALHSDGQTATFGPNAHSVFATLGIDLEEARKAPLKLCLDWTERKPHLSGPLATALMDHALAQHWILRQTNSRALTITNKGYAVFDNSLSLTRETLEADT